MSNKQRMRQGKFMAIWIPVLTVLVAVILAITIVTDVYAKAIDFALGGGTMKIEQAEGTEDWDTDYYAKITDEAALKSEAQDLTEQIAGEGFVLLKNNSDALPLTGSGEKKISAFGWSFSHPVYGGTGSGSVDTETCVTPQKGLENAGFSVNPTLVSAYDTWSKTHTYDNAVNTGSGTTTALMSAFGRGSRVSISCDERPTLDFGYGNWDLIEAPVSALNMSEAREYADVALIMIARQGGEQSDLPTNMGANTFYGRSASDCFGYNENKHYLELTDEEEALIAAVKEQHFEKVIVVVNSANPVELGELQNDNGIDAILFAPGPGQTGFNALGKILSGEINPSGKTSDIFATDFTANPSFVNFSDPNYYEYAMSAMSNVAYNKQNAYSNIDKTNSYDNGFFVQYEEGIYIGYKYYETAYDIGASGFDYEEEVIYPFGYGLSYTEFSQRIVSTSFGGNTMSVTVEVENTGDVAGKCTVQLYVNPPYTDHDRQYQVEKATANLVAFGKTEELKAGGKTEITLTFAKDYLTSYDETCHKAYILGKGDYEFSIRSDSHTVLDSKTWTNTRDYIYNEENDGARQSEIDAQGYQESYVAATNAFDSYLIDEEMSKMENLTRSDNFATKPQAPTDADRLASDAMVEAAAQYEVVNDDTDVMPETEADNGLALIDMRGLDADDAAWDDLLDQLSIEDMVSLVNGCGFGTPSLSSVQLPQTVVNDGPQGLSDSWAGMAGSLSVDTNAYTSEVTLACTFNTELAKQMGELMGKESLMFREHNNNVPFAGLYAPGANIHRSPFGGRNFEYYSEDALLSGKMAAATISGAMENGLYMTMKHFALNDQESYRSGWGYASNNCLYTWATEQTIREGYLRAFEIAVKEASCEVKYISDTDGTVSTKEIRACTAIMTSFNALGSTWTGANYGLITQVLRNEWGFDGQVITDYMNGNRAYMDQDAMIRAGGDVSLCTTNVALADTSSATAVTAMREAAKHFLYSTVYSNAMNGLAPGTIVSYSLAPWRICVIIVNILGYGFVAASAVLIVLRYFDGKKHPENYKTKKSKK